MLLAIFLALNVVKYVSVCFTSSTASIFRRYSKALMWNLGRSFKVPSCLADNVSVSAQFSFIYFTLGYSIYIVYVTNRNKITNKRRKKKKEVNGFGRSVRWSEELSFRAEHRYIINANTNIAWCHGNYGRSILILKYI